jgi:hypothetical protein
MPDRPPPSRFDGTPNRMLLPAGTRLWRVHPDRYGVEAFNPGPAPAGPGGGRFDSTPADRYPFWYGAPVQETALAETLLRDLPFDEAGARLLPHERVRGRRLSAVETTVELCLISLRSMRNLAAIGQDDWLVQAEPDRFPATRTWARWLRAQDPTAQGLIWQSRRDRPNEALVLFQDRDIKPGALVPCPLPSVALWTAEGIGWLNVMLRPYRTSVAPPGSP